MLKYFIALLLVACTQQPTRTVLDCSNIVTDPQMVPKDKYKWCEYKQVPIPPKSKPLPAPESLVK